MDEARREPSGSVHGLGPVQETMLITVWARAEESLRPDGLFRDDLAVEVSRSLAPALARFRGAWKSQVGVAVRTRMIDETARSFLARHPQAVVANLGAGLDTRFHRIDDGRVRWFDIDLPDAIALRRRHLPESSRSSCIACSLFDEAWISEVRDAGPGPVLVLAEGVLMFLEMRRVRTLLEHLATTLPSGEAVLDCIGRWMVRHPWLHDSVGQTRARFRWGLRSPDEISAWSDAYDVVGVDSMLAEATRRWRWMRWLRWVPGFDGQFVVARLRFPPRGPVEPGPGSAVAARRCSG